MRYTVKNSVITNSELDKHRRAFLGKPGSKKWQKYYDARIRTKWALFDGGSRKTRKNTAVYSSGGEPQKRNCSIQIGWLIDLFQTNEMTDLLVFTQEQINAGKIKVPDSWTVDADASKEDETEKKKENEKFDIRNFVNEIIKNPKKGPCNAEDIKIQYIPFFLQVYMQLISTLREEVKRDNANDIFGSFSDSSSNPVGSVDDSNAVSVAASVAASNAVSVDDSNAASVADSNAVSVAASNAASVAAAISAATIQPTNIEQKQNGGSPDSKTEKLRTLLLFNINLLRNMNMYANPMFFDDLYYYYYFLSIDKILPSMDDLFRAFETPEPEPSNTKRNSKTNVKMRLYEQFPNDDPSKEAQDEKYYGYEMMETRTGENPNTNFDLFLNLVQLHPDFNYQLPVKSEVERDFTFEQIPVNKDGEKTTQNIAKIQVVKPTKMGGGGVFDSIYSAFGVSSNAEKYNYLEDNPFAREFEDVLEDENDTYSGNVHLCIYSLDTSCDFDGNGPTPFLKFITVKNGEKWGFPSFHYTSLQDPEQNNKNFKCEMFDALLRELELQLCSEQQKGGGSDPNNPPLNNDQKQEVGEVNATDVKPLGEQNPGEEESKTDVGAIPERRMSVGIGRFAGETKYEFRTENLDVNLQNQLLKEESKTDVRDVNLQNQLPKEESKTDGRDVNLQNQLLKEESKTDGRDVNLANTNLAEEQKTTNLRDVNPQNQLPKEESKTDLRDVNTQNQTPVKEEPKTIEDFLSPEIAVIQSAKEQCTKIESELDSMYIGLVSEKVQETRQIFVFLNYDYLERMVQTPENKAQAGMLFCRNPDSQLYPIIDSNKNAKLKWATIDELVFEKKIINEDIDPAVSDLFAKNEKLWNIEDSDSNYIAFPFVVFAAELSDNHYKTVLSPTDSKEDPFALNGKMETYGTPQNKEDQGIADEYDERYCFTLQPLSSSDPDTSLPPPRRYAMFAWKTRYVVPEEPVVGGDGNTRPENPLKLEFEDSPKSPLKLDLEEDEDATVSEEKKDQIALEKLKFPTIYTITQNEFTDNKPLVMWGILNSKQFVGL